METPSSSRRVTRSQALSAINKSDSDSIIPFSSSTFPLSNVLVVSLALNQLQITTNFKNLQTKILNSCSWISLLSCRFHIRPLILFLFLILFLHAIVFLNLTIFLHCGSDKTEDSSICQRKKEDRSALIDITNDSPIVGLALQTPPSGFMVKRKSSRIKNTPGSGEALLRGQVKTLLNKVEEETELIHSIKTLPFTHLVTSPLRLLAPTPANTPQFPNFSDNDVKIKIASPIVAGHLRTSQMIEETEEKSMSITRSLLFDFTDKSASWEEEDTEEDVDGCVKKWKWWV